MSEKRYFVDHRGGCIAVRDRTLTEPDYPGLHHDTRGVVFYRHGKIVQNTCQCCGQKMPGNWEVDPQDVLEAEQECYRLNAAEPASDQ